MGKGSLYLKLEWVKYGWGLSDYLRHHGGRLQELAGPPGDGPVLLDDGELLWRFGSVYRNLVRDIRGRQIVGAFREFDVDAATVLFGDGFTIYLQKSEVPKAAAKAPLGLAFLGRTAEVIVL
jgi:hypothetical protein